MLLKSKSCNLLRPIFIIEISIAPIINNLLCMQTNQQKLNSLTTIVHMARNDIRLNSTVHAEIYKSCLVEIDNHSHAKRSPSSKHQTPVPTENNATTNSSLNTWKHLGEFKKRILLVVNYPGFVYLPD